MRTDKLAAVALAVGLIGCVGLSACRDAGTTARGGPAPTSAAPGTSDAAPPATAHPAPTESTAPTDPAADLAAALDRLGDRYHFTTTATVDGVLAATVEGDRVGAGSRLVVRQGGSTLEYVVLADAGWVRTEGGEWEEVDAAVTDPLTALHAPTQVTVDPVSAALVAHVPAVAIGVPGDGVAEVLVTVVDGIVAGFDYRTTLDGRPVAVQVVLGPVVDGSAAVAPA